MIVPERQSPVSTLAFYSLPVFFLETGRIAVTLFLATFWLGEMGLEEDLVYTLGLILVASRLVSAVFAGPIADLFPGRAGRRRIFLMIGALLAAAGLWSSLMPFGTGFMVVAGSLILMEFGVLLFHAAHLGWGVEMTRTYHSRTAVLQWRVMAMTLGWFFGLFLGFALDASPEEVTTQVMGWSAAIAAIGLVFSCILFISIRTERMPEDYRPVALEMEDGMAAFTTNPVVRRVVIAGMLLCAVVMIDLVMHPVVLAEVAGQPDAFYPLLMVELLVATVMTLIWCRFSLNWGKANAAAAAFLWAAISGFPLVVFTGEDLTPLVLFVCLRAAAYGGLFALLLSMAGDAADVDLFRTGRQRTGTIVSGILFFWIAASAGTFYGLHALLDTISDAPEDIRETIWLLLYAIVPLVALSLAAVFIRSVPINARVHAEMRDEIAKQKKRVLALDL